jgi:L-aminopeptidase/D-esterase-like protein
MSDKMSNDSAKLFPKESNGSVLEFDFPAFKIGTAEYDEGPTGCTVFYFPNEVKTVIDIRGGSPATINTDNAYLKSGEFGIDAFCFSGGSTFGLESVSGVNAEILKINENAVDKIPKVVGAIIYDYVNRDNSIHPDKALGRAAFRTAQFNRFPLGSQGAGRSATVGKGYLECESGGQGGAFRQIGPTKIAVFTVVNSIGAIIDRSGKVVRGYWDKENNVRQPIQTSLEKFNFNPSEEGKNTTLTLVVTNQKLPAAQLRQLSRQIHTSMARAIYPFHTMADGDVLFMATTNEVENAELDPNTLGLIGSEIAWDAVLNSIKK